MKRDFDTTAFALWFGLLMLGQCTYAAGSEVRKGLSEVASAIRSK